MFVKGMRKCVMFMVYERSTLAVNETEAVPLVQKVVLEI